MAYIISTCPNCKEENFPEAHFCIGCGESLLDTPVTKINTQTGAKEHIQRHRSLRNCPECGWANPGSFDACGKCQYDFESKEIRQDQPKRTHKPKPTEVIDEAEEAVVSPLPKIKKSHPTRNKILVGIAILGFIFYGPISDFFLVASNSISADEEIKDIAENSGFSYSGKVLFYRAKPELVTADTLNRNCPNDDESVIEYGCYLPSDNKMYILQVADSSYKDIEYTTAAHETLHAAWRQYGSAEKQRITTLLKEVYNNPANPSSASLHETLKPYGESEQVINGELHSFIGSEVGGTDLGEPLANYYAKYFDDQYAPVRANKQFSDSIAAKTAALNAENTRLDNLSASIDTYKRQHLDNIEAAMRRANYYGDTYSYNKNVDAFNNNRIYYNDQITLLDKGIDAYNVELNTFNATLRAFYPTRATLNAKQSVQP